MSRSSRVYSVANCDNRARPVGFGGEFHQRIMVGSSASYSNDFATVSVDERKLCDAPDWSCFRLAIDGEYVKRALFNNRTKQYIPIALDAVAADEIAAHGERS